MTFHDNPNLNPRPRMKNTPTEKPQEAPEKEDVKSHGQQKPDNASERATEKAKQGQPLEARRPGERSPKQENL